MPFRVLTLNVWFDAKLQAARTRALLHVLRQLRPDVVCLQEVLPHVAQVLVQELGRDGWACSDRGDGQSVQPYGVFAAVAPPHAAQCRFAWHDFPTAMCRRLLVCRLPGLTVGTVHLESLSNAPLRAEQLQISHQALSLDPEALLVGDFNFCSERNFHGTGPLENLQLSRIMPEYTDLWPLLRPGAEEIERGKTFDSTRNPYINKYERMRYDRCVGKLRAWRAAGIELVGAEPVDVPLSPEEQALTERPPTPPRPTRRERLSDVGTWSPEKADETPIGNGQNGHETPRKAKGVFLSDHFGLLVTLERHEA